MQIALTGATSPIGKLIAKNLDEFTAESGAMPAGITMKLLTRHPEKLADNLRQGHDVGAGDYSDTASFVTALSGSEVLFLAPADLAPNRLDLHRNAISAAKEAGVKHVVYLSWFGAGREHPSAYGVSHRGTERALADSGLDYTVLRSGLLIDVLAGAVVDGNVVFGPGKAGSCAFVTMRDVADAVVGVLVDIAAGAGGGHAGKTYTLTGPKALTMAEAVAEVNRGSSERTGVTLHFHPLSAQEAESLLSEKHPHLPPELLKQWSEMFHDLEQGELDEVSHDLRKLLGAPGRSVQQWANAGYLPKVG